MLEECISPEQKDKPVELRTLLHLFLKLRGRSYYGMDAEDGLDILISWLGPVSYNLPEGAEGFNIFPYFMLSQLEELSSIFWRNRHHPIDIPKAVLYLEIMSILYGHSPQDAFLFFSTQTPRMCEKV